MTTPPRPRVVVTVGGDHHPFTRLMHWLDAWLATPSGQHCQLFVQHGTAAPPRLAAEAAPFLDHDLLLARLHAADAVVTSAGPSTVSECRRVGVLPIAVPRRAALGEVVDDHQLLFIRSLARRQLAFVAETQAELLRLLDRACADPGTFRLPDPVAAQAAVSRTVGSIGEQIDRHVAMTRARRRAFI